MSYDTDGLPFPEFASVLPAADRGNLSRLSPSEVPSWTTARVGEYRKFALALLAIHNTAVSIHRLPNELLSHIFAHSWHGRKSLRLTHVCRRWRQAMLATAEFWADAVGGEEFCMDGKSCTPLEYLHSIFQSSARLPIQPSFAHFTPASSRTLEAHLWRISTLVVRTMSLHEVAEIHGMLRKGMPVLAELIVRHEPQEGRYVREHRHAPPEMGPLPPHALPCLSHAELPSLLFLHISAHSLRRVRLGRGRYHDHDNSVISMPVAGVLAALARCPGLVRLELSSAITSFAIQPREADRAIALPALEFFQIEDLSSGVSALVPHIVFPPSTRIQIAGTDMVNLRPALLYVVTADIDRVSITVGHGPALMQCRSGREERLRVTSHPTSAGIQGLADALRSKASIAELEWIRTQEYAGEVLYLPLILCTLQNITSLTVCGFDVDGVLDVLETSEDSPTVCPHLERLILGFLSSYTLSWYFLDAEGLPQEAVPEASTSVSSRCARIQPMLQARASRIGSRLTYLELYEFSKPQRGFTSLRLVTIEKTSPFWTSIEPSLQALRSLVDGPVMVGGFKTEINPPDP